MRTRPTSWWLAALHKRRERMHAETLDLSLPPAFASPEGRATAEDAARLQELAPVRSMIFTVDDA